MIVGSAIKLDGIVYSVPKPGRHHHVIRLMRDKGIVPHAGTQGFVTEDGTFLDRTEGAKYALETGQIQKLKTPPDLFSEDLW